MYTFSLKDYRAVKSADIKIDGITVLAGINACGKSTISRWLYYLVNAAHQFESFQRSFFLNALLSEVSKVQRVLRSTQKNSGFPSLRRRLQLFNDDAELDLDALKEVYDTFVKKANDELHLFAKEHYFMGDLLMNFLLDKDVKGEVNTEQVIKEYLEECARVYENGVEIYLKAIASYKKTDLNELIKSEFSDGEGMPAHISLKEGQMPLIQEDSFIPPLLLSRAIYVDSPMAVSGSDFSLTKGIWGDFHNYLYDENPDKPYSPSMSLEALIQSIIGGRIQMESDDVEIGKELHFVSQEGSVNINIDEAATGIKTFAYMSRLLENGWLNKDTLLLIDEPEAHLHPQWVVEFARLLVKIHKELGVRIMIASHNPDMIAAIQAIATKEEVIKNTVFYLAQREKEDERYTFAEKGTEIGDIFSSFNIALTRIELYGTAVM